ncbi:MAG TPA: hypothetical protein DEP05_07725 [Betaproteobacteria bacterium]|nr:hypothetical protein [Betaproteobacteria bacterium]
MKLRAMLGAALAAVVVLVSGCSALRQPPGEPAAETAAQRYGQYCEQLGHLKGTPGFDACIRRQENIYQ